MSEWIKCLDRLPEIKDKLRESSQSEDVLIYCDDIQYVGYLQFSKAGGYRKKDGYYWSERSTGCGCCSQSLNPTHWMPCPKIPKE